MPDRPWFSCGGCATVNLGSQGGDRLPLFSPFTITVLPLLSVCPFSLPSSSSPWLSQLSFN